MGVAGEPCADAVFDVVPLEKQRDRQTAVGDDLGGQQARPPAVPAGVETRVLLLLDQVDAHARTGGQLAGLDLVEHLAFGADVQHLRVAQRQHLRADDRRLDGHVRERVHAQHRFRFAQDVVVHEDDVGVRRVRRTRDLVHAAGETAGATEVGLGDVDELAAETVGDVAERRARLHLVGALIDHAHRIDVGHRALVGGEPCDGDGAVVGAVVGADDDGGGAQVLGSGDGPAHVGDVQRARRGLRGDPQAPPSTKRSMVRSRSSSPPDPETFSTVTRRSRPRASDAHTENVADPDDA